MLFLYSIIHVKTTWGLRYLAVVNLSIWEISVVYRIVSVILQQLFLQTSALHFSNPYLPPNMFHHALQFSSYSISSFQKEAFDHIKEHHLASTFLLPYRKLSQVIKLRNILNFMTLSMVILFTNTNY